MHFRQAMSPGRATWRRRELLRTLGNEDLLQTELFLRLIPEESLRMRPMLLAIQARVIGGRTGWRAALPVLDAAQAALDQEGPSTEEKVLIARWSD